MKLYEYIARRLILMFFVLLGLSVVIFYLTRGVLPPVTSTASYVTAEMSDGTKLGIAQAIGVAENSCPSWSAFVSRNAGCIVPLWQQYFSWMHNILTGNWGFTLLPDIGGGVTTWNLFLSRFPYTAELAISAAILTILISFPLGVISATHNNKIADHISRLISLIGHCTPIFWLGFLLQLVFVIYIGVPIKGEIFSLLPSSGVLATTCAICIANPGHIRTYSGLPVLDALLSGNLAYTWDSLVALILPTITLSFAVLGSLTRIIRSSMLEALRQDYIILARSKGLRERTVIYRHALRNAILPALTITGLIFASLFGGVIIVEEIFDWPGIGQAALQASVYFDVNFLELYALTTSLIVILSNLAVDILYAYFDPRIRL